MDDFSPAVSILFILSNLCLFLLLSDFEGYERFHLTKCVKIFSEFGINLLDNDIIGVFSLSFRLLNLILKSSLSDTIILSIGKIEFKLT